MEDKEKMQKARESYGSIIKDEFGFNMGWYEGFRAGLETAIEIREKAVKEHEEWKKANDIS